MKYHIGILKFKTPLHLGDREGWREGSDSCIHSDTLFSAFCHNYRLLYGNDRLTELLKEFNTGRPPFRISSTFPYWDSVYYFPIPKNQIAADKDLKKIIYISKNDLEQLLSGKTLDQLKERITGLPKKEEPRTPWITADVPRVNLSRLTNHPGENFFYFGETVYQKNAGLFFLYELNELQFEKEFIATFNLMADEGIGGDRSSGKGLMEPPQFSELDITVPATPNAVYLVSLYFPKSDECQYLSQGYYELLERKGYIYSPEGTSLRRKSVRMFAEGTIFPQTHNGLLGQLINVKPEAFTAHPVYRYGLLFGLPCLLG